MSYRMVLAFFLCVWSVSASEAFRVRAVDPHAAVIPQATVDVLRSQAPMVVRVSAPGFTSRTVSLESFQDEEITVELVPAPVFSAIDVVVKDREAGEPNVSTALEIERGGARTVFDAVDRVLPGVTVTRRGVMGYGIATNGTGQISIRGVGGQPNTGVLVVVDGRPDYQGLMGHPLPDFYSLSDAGTVSVTQGPASVLYGSNAMGGVIEIKPSQPSRGRETRLDTSLGSFYTGQHRLSHGGTFRRGYYSAKAGVLHTSGDRPSSDFRDHDGTLSAGLILNDRWRTSLQGRFGHFHVEDPGPIGSPLASSYARVGRGGGVWSLDNDGSRSWGQIRLYSSRGRHYITDGFRSVDSTTGVRAHQQVVLSPVLVVDGGADVVRYGGRARNVLRRLEYGEHHLNSSAGFGRLHWTPRWNLRLNTGLRHERNTASGAITVPEFGAVVGLSPRYSLSVAAGKGFRHPTLRELYLFPAPNPDLLPERMWNYQAGIQAHPIRNLSATATVFYADLDNLIMTAGRAPFLQLLNGGRTLNRGGEVTVRWRPHRRMAVQSGYAYLRSTNLPPSVPSHKWTYSVELHAGPAFLHIGGISAGSRWADPRKTRRLPGYSVPGVKGSIPLSARYSFFAMVDNLLNERYEVVAGYPMPGLNAAAGFTARF